MMAFYVELTMQKWLYSSILLSICLLLTACGQTGNLYLPAATTTAGNHSGG